MAQREAEKPSTLDRIVGFANDRIGAVVGESSGSGASTVFVAGLGRFGAAVCATLVDLGVEVMGVDIDEHLVDKWVDVIPHLRVADTTDANTLKQLGVAGFDVCVVAIGTSVEASVLTVAALSDAGAPMIWAKAITAEHGRILERVGAHNVVNPEHEMGQRLARIVSGSVIDFFKLDDNFVMAELETPNFLVGTALSDAHLRAKYEVSVVSIKPRDEAHTYVTAETVPGSGSIIVVAGPADAVQQFVERAKRSH